LPTFSKQTETGIKGISYSFATAAGCAVECPPIAGVIGGISLTLNGALLYNKIAIMHNNGELNPNVSNIIDGIGMVVGFIDPRLSAAYTWVISIPKDLIEGTSK